MKLKLTNEEPNYAATVVSIKQLVALDGLDNLRGVSVFGYNALISKDHEVGELGIVFTAESKLSEDFCHHNNLNTDSSLNKDTDSKGYISKRRIRAIKLRGHISSALWIPISSLEYLGADISKLKDGDTFTHINGELIVEKYVIIQQNNDMKNKVKGKNKKWLRIDNKMFPEHLDTEHYLKNKDKVPGNIRITVTNKTHGSSGRFANLPVKRKLSFLEKVAKWMGVGVKETEYDVLAGSRRVIKDTKSDKENENYYADDIWNRQLNGDPETEINEPHFIYGIKHLIPKDWIIYGEIVGWTKGGAEIQKNYSYCLPKGQSKLFIYRIAVVNADGQTVDLSWDAVKEFCKENGLEHVQEMWVGDHKDFNPEDWLDKRYYDEGYTHCPQVENKKLVDEGVVIRVEKQTPYLLKLKSPLFLQHETKMLDQNVVDIESQESENV